LVVLIQESKAKEGRRRRKKKKKKSSDWRTALEQFVGHMLS
jgi:hypothetical protein